MSNNVFMSKVTSESLCVKSNVVNELSTFANLPIRFLGAQCRQMTGEGLAGSVDHAALKRLDRIDE